MKRIILSLLVCLCYFSSVNAQQVTSPANTLESQFDDVINKSNSYQEFKVIKKFKINQLRSNVLDSVSGLKLTITGLNGEIATRDAEISSLNETLSATNAALALSKEKEDGIHLFGALLSKFMYNAILWSIIGILIILTGFFMMKFKRSNYITQEANSKLSETEAEFEAHRTRALEREQQLRRKLQDELIKNKKTK